MASGKQHQAQWLHNRGFLASILHQPDNADWMTTVAFYTAVHAVQTLLCADGQTRSFSHESRGEILVATPRYNKIWPDYKALYDASRAARYDCSGWLDAQVVRDELIRRRLIYIERRVVSLGKLTVVLPDLFAPPSPTDAPQT